MVFFSELAIPFVIFLIAINTIFAATTTLPGGQFADSNRLFTDISGNPDLNHSMFTYVNSINADTNTASIDSNTGKVTVSTGPTDLVSSLFNIGNAITFGGLGYVTKFIGFVTQMTFGYTTWLDYFFNPAWGAFVWIIGGIFKAFFLIIEVYAVVSIYTALVGRKI